MGYVYLSAAFVLNGIANILLKLAAERFVPGPLLQVGNLSWQLLLGIALFACNVLLYTLALRLLPLSVAYPTMLAGGFVIVNGFAFFALQESLTALVMLGYICIISGVCLVLYASGV